MDRSISIAVVMIAVSLHVSYASEADKVEFKAGNFTTKIQIDQNFPPDFRKTLISDLQTMASIPDTGQPGTPLHQEIFKGPVSGETYLRWFSKVVHRISYNPKKELPWDARAEGLGILNIFGIKKVLIPKISLSHFFFDNKPWTRLAVLIHEARHNYGHIHGVIQKKPTWYTKLESDYLSLPYQPDSRDELEDNKIPIDHNEYGAYGAELCFLINASPNTLGEDREYTALFRISNPQSQKRILEEWESAIHTMSFDNLVDLYFSDEIERRAKQRELSQEELDRALLLNINSLDSNFNSIQILTQAGADISKVVEKVFPWKLVDAIGLYFSPEEIVQLKIDHKIDINMNSQDQMKMTPLMMAVLAGDIPRIKLLLSLGADPNLKDRDHRTALDVVETLKANRRWGEDKPEVKSIKQILASAMSSQTGPISSIQK